MSGSALTFPKLYDAQLAICEARVSEVGWDSLFHMVSYLDKDGQSSDKTDGGTQYRVKIQSWRSPEVSALLYHINAQRPTTNDLGNQHSGSAPHHRHYSDKITSRQAEDIPARLPVNLYNPMWYESLVMQYQQRLHPKSAIYLPEINYIRMA